LLGDDLGEGAFAGGALFGIGGEEDEAGAVAAIFGKGDVGVALGDLDEEVVGESGEDAGAVTGVDFATAGAAVVHVLEHGEGVADDVVGFFALDVGDEANAAGVVLEPGIVEAHLLWETRWGEGVQIVRLRVEAWRGA
jgi:hypothetical protein